MPASELSAENRRTPAIDAPDGAPSQGEGSPGWGDSLGWLASLAAHAAMLVALGLVTQIPPLEDFPLLVSMPVVEPPEELADAFRVADSPAPEVGAMSDGGVGDAAAAAPLEADLPEAALELPTTRDLGDIPTLEAQTPLLASPDPNDHLVVRGLGSVGETGSRGAIDRLTGEILLSLEDRPTVVVWLFDGTASLRPQREEIVARFDRVYQELGVAAERGAEGFERQDSEDPPLLTTVASFGAQIEFLTPRPTADLHEIKAAVRAVSADDSGRENVFGGVLAAVEHHRRYRTRKAGRNVMIVVVTDESGDDVGLVDQAIDVCRKRGIRVYAVGAPAPFGRAETYVRYVDPDPRYDQSPQYLPVTQGPETLLPERLKLGYQGRGDFDGPQLDSGFGPYGLSRLAAESGGFFIAVHPFRVDSGPAERRRLAENSLVAEIDYFFDPRVMNRYRPDYVPLAEYERRRRENRARDALLRAAEASWTAELENVRRDFPRLDEAQLAEDLSRAQQSAAFLEPKLRELVDLLQTGVVDRPQLDGARWQAGFDLAMGHALASLVRTEGYNRILGDAKQGMPFTNPKSDTWVLDPDTVVRTGAVAERQAAAAREYLERVVAEHAETPWALLARRELETPMGWRWREEFRNVAERARRAEREARERPPRPEPEPKPRRTPRL